MEQNQQTETNKERHMVNVACSIILKDVQHVAEHLTNATEITVMPEAVKIKPRNVKFIQQTRVTLRNSMWM